MPGGAGKEQSLFRRCCGFRAADGDQAVGDDAEAYPAVHSVVAAVSGAIEAVSALGHADATFRTGAPSLTLAKPAFVLRAFALGALGGTIGDTDALDAHRRGGGFVFE